MYYVFIFFSQFQGIALKHLITDEVDKVEYLHSNRTMPSYHYIQKHFNTLHIFEAFHLCTSKHSKSKNCRISYLSLWPLCLDTNVRAAREQRGCDQGWIQSKQWKPRQLALEPWQCHKEIKPLCVYHFIQSRWVVFPILQSSSCINTKPWLVFL